MYLRLSMYSSSSSTSKLQSCTLEMDEALSVFEDAVVVEVVEGGGGGVGGFLKAEVATGASVSAPPPPPRHDPQSDEV